MPTSASDLLRNSKFPVVALLLQAIFLILFGVFVDYTPRALPLQTANTTIMLEVVENVTTGEAVRDVDGSVAHALAARNEINAQYTMFQDLHVMVYIGFGFLVTFLKRYGYSGVGINMLVAAFVVQWGTLTNGWIMNFKDGRIAIDMLTLINAEFAAATVLISFCAVIGKTSPLQLLVMGLIETVVCQFNSLIVYVVFQASDIGASLTVHTFGAFFGLTVAWIYYRSDLEDAQSKEGSTYQSDIFAMIGTLFLWLFWPSFNSLTAVGEGQYRAIINTYYSLVACTIVTFAWSALVHRGKYSMVHVQNATLAGGVAVGCIADMIIYPWGAILVGMIAGTVSVLGYRFLTPFLLKKLRLHDTCGVNNLHGMPGVISGLASILCAAIATETVYGDNLVVQFPALGKGRTSAQQAGFQAAALIVSITTGIAGGIVTGLILRVRIWDKPRGRQYFDDHNHWLVPAEGFTLVNPEICLTLENKLHHIDSERQTDILI